MILLNIDLNSFVENISLDTKEKDFNHFSQKKKILCSTNSIWLKIQESLSRVKWPCMRSSKHELALFKSKSHQLCIYVWVWLSIWKLSKQKETQEIIWLNAFMPKFRILKSSLLWGYGMFTWVLINVNDINEIVSKFSNLSLQRSLRNQLWILCTIDKNSLFDCFVQCLVKKNPLDFFLSSLIFCSTDSEVIWWTFWIISSIPIGNLLEIIN